MQRFTAPGLFAPPDYAHAAVVEAGERLVFTAGSVPLDPSGAVVEGLEAQTRQVLANLDEALREAGSELAKVVNSTVYVVASEPEELSRVWEIVRASPLAAGPHTSTLLGVPVLGYSGQLVEITAVAVAG
ncbi:RidA family protein [Allonocardiopsis opalescens]|uniref:Enamine deaminase RidA (YjgF/YER057c/UK114 family) n=1 Tax=Allonocardiopsis opalescens TaxID=1144618 RepID=A0A2T0Q0T8_9ACTN|nr:enamine deaminase RidA (YjgF/YER057c/UK114 family) [Allonocardiopsis opalescens]